MTNEPGSIWGKLAVITAFITALAGLGTSLKQCSDEPGPSAETEYRPAMEYNSTPEYPNNVAPLQTSPLQYQQPHQSTLFCCDIYNNKQCQIIVNPGPLGSPCWCSNVPGTGMICQ